MPDTVRIYILQLQHFITRNVHKINYIKILAITYLLCDNVVVIEFKKHN